MTDRADLDHVVQAAALAYNGAGTQGAAEPAPPEPIIGIKWPTLAGRMPPEREFIVPDWLGVGYVTSGYAPGGYGKTLLGQLLGTCVATGTPFLGMPVLKRPVLGLFCEDDDDELWRRQDRINRSLSRGMADLSTFVAQGRLGMSNPPMGFPGGTPTPLKLLEETEAKAKEIGAGLVILDNAAQMYGGNEIDRAQVTAFLNALNGLGRRLNAAVLLFGHPPKSGSEYSGSTAWHSVVRGMWTMTRPSDHDSDVADPTGLVLSRFKANYAPTGDQIRLRWVDGALRRDDGDVPMSAMDATYHRHNAKLTFLAALDELTAQRRALSHSSRAGNYAPKMIKAAGLAGIYGKADLERAMNDLLAERTIIASAELWKGGDRKPVTGLARSPGTGK